MSFKTRFPLLSLSVLRACSGQALAFGFGEIQTNSRLGERLQADITLHLQKGEHVAANCFRLLKPGSGELPWLTAGSFSLHDKVLSLKSDRPVTEPILVVALEMTCGHDLQREYTLMLSPPLQGPQLTPREAVASSGNERPGSGNGRRIRAGETPASVAAELYPDSRADQRRFIQALIRNNRNLGLKHSRGKHQALPEGEMLIIPDLPPLPPAPLPRPRTEMPRREAPDLPRPPLAEPSGLPLGQPLLGDRLVLSDGGVVDEAPLRLAAELGVIPTENVTEELLLQRKILRLEYRMLAFQETRDETVHLPAADRLKALEAVLGEQQLPGASSQGAAVPAAAEVVPKPALPQARPVRVTPADGGNWGWWLGGAASVLAVGALAWRTWRRRQKTRDDERQDDLHFSLSRLESTHPVIDPLDAFEVPLNPRRAAAMPSAATQAMHSVFDDLPQETGAVTQNKGPESILDASVDESFSYNPVMELADVMLAFGRVKGAAQALQEYVDQNPKEALQPWVKLLEVYRLADMKDEFERLARSLNENFNVELLHWSDMPKADDPAAADFVLELVPQGADTAVAAARPQSIEAIPHICERIQSMWGTSQCFDYIQSLLRDNRGGSRQGFPLAVVDELLLLSELLRLEEHSVSLAPDIDPSANPL